MYLNNMPMSETGLQLAINQRLSALFMTSSITKEIKDDLARFNKEKNFINIKWYVNALDIPCDGLQEIVKWINNYFQS